MKTTTILAFLISIAASFGADYRPVTITVRTGRVISAGTRLEYIDPSLRADDYFLPRLGAPFSQSQSATIFRASADAESINARAMHRYQQRWESHLRTPRASPAPTLYPSRFERTFEITR